MVRATLAVALVVTSLVLCYDHYTMELYYDEE